MDEFNKWTHNLLEDAKQQKVIEKKIKEESQKKAERVRRRTYKIISETREIAKRFAESLNATFREWHDESSNPYFLILFGEGEQIRIDFGILGHMFRIRLQHWCISLYANIITESFFHKAPSVDRYPDKVPLNKTYKWDGEAFSHDIHRTWQAVHHMPILPASDFIPTLPGSDLNKEMLEGILKYFCELALSGKKIETKDRYP